MSRRARTHPGQHREEPQDRQKNPTIRRALHKSYKCGERRRSEDCEKKGVVQPAERLRIYEAELDEHAEREVREEKGHRGVEDQNVFFRVIHNGL